MTSVHNEPYFNFSHLDDPSHRETYESAHSVILAVFAAHARAQSESTTVLGVKGKGTLRATFVEKIVPFYVQCLLEVCVIVRCILSLRATKNTVCIQNSIDGKLTTSQLRLAFSALTSSASASTPAMGKFCISSLISLLSSLSANEDAQRRHRLGLVLVSTLSALPLAVLPDALAAVANEMKDSKSEKRAELASEVFKEIMENVGDREKEYCLRWWEEQREALEGSAEAKSGEGALTLARL